MTSSIQVTSYETSRERFVGCYRDLSNPIAVEESNCSNYLAQRGNGVGCLNHEIKLEPGCEKEIIYILGTTPSKQTVKEKISSFLDPEQVEQEKRKV